MLSRLPSSSIWWWASAEAIDAQALRILTGCLLIGWGAFYLVYGHRHRVRIGLRTGYVGLGVWSFLMASAHGAGLMLIPALMPLQEHAQQQHMHAMPAGKLALDRRARGRRPYPRHAGRDRHRRPPRL